MVWFLLNFKSHLPLSSCADGKEIVRGSTKTTGKAIIFNSTKTLNLLKINQLRSTIKASFRQLTEKIEVSEAFALQRASTDLG
jgi:hypothetical protein